MGGGATCERERGHARERERERERERGQKTGLRREVKIANKNDQSASLADRQRGERGGQGPGSAASVRPV